MITYFEDKNHKSKNNYKNLKTLTPKLESLDTDVIVVSTKTSVTLSITGFELLVLPISAGIASALSLGIEVGQKTIFNKYNKHKKLDRKDVQAIKSSDQLCRKSLQEILIHKNFKKSRCKIFNKYVDEKQ